MVVAKKMGYENSGSIYAAFADTIKKSQMVYGELRDAIYKGEVVFMEFLGRLLKERKLKAS